MLGLPLTKRAEPTDGDVVANQGEVQLPIVTSSRVLCKMHWNLNRNQNSFRSKNKRTSSASSVCWLTGEQSAQTSRREIMGQYFIRLSRGGQTFRDSRLIHIRHAGHAGRSSDIQQQGFIFFGKLRSVSGQKQINNKQWLSGSKELTSS